MDESLVVTPTEDVAFREIDGEAVLLDLASGTYFGLNEVATRAWTLLVEGQSLGSVAVQLEREFEVAIDVVQRDLDVWLGQLVEKGLMRPR